MRRKSQCTDLEIVDLLEEGVILDDSLPQHCVHCGSELEDNGMCYERCDGWAFDYMLGD